MNVITPDKINQVIDYETLEMMRCHFSGIDFNDICEILNKDAEFLDKNNSALELPEVLNNTVMFPEIKLNELRYPIDGHTSSVVITIKFKLADTDHLSTRMGFFNPYAYKNADDFYSDIMQLKLNNPDSEIDSYYIDHRIHEYSTNENLLTEARKAIKTCLHCRYKNNDTILKCAISKNAINKFDTCEQWAEDVPVNKIDDPFEPAYISVTPVKNNKFGQFKDYDPDSPPSLKFFYSESQDALFQKLQNGCGDKLQLIYQIKIGDNWHTYTQCTIYELAKYIDAQLVLEVQLGEKYTIKDSLGQVFEHTFKMEEIDWCVIGSI